MGKAIRASALALLLACTTQAGIIQNGSPEPPPPPPTSAAVSGYIPNDTAAAPQPTDAVQEQTADGVMQNGVTGGLTQVALELLAALPSLL